MSGVVQRSFSTSREWVNRVLQVQKGLTKLQWSLVDHSVNRAMFQGFLKESQERIKQLSTAKFEQGKAPQFQRQIIEELEETAKRVSESGKKTFLDRKERLIQDRS